MRSLFNCGIRNPRALGVAKLAPPHPAWRGDRSRKGSASFKLGAMPSPLSWDFPYPSQRMPVFARNVVATTQPLAVQAGLHMLRQGGNAVDAAVATAISMTVLEPINNAVG